MASHFWDYQLAGVEYEDWDTLAQDEYREYLEEKRIEKWEREHGYDEEEKSEGEGSEEDV